MPQVRELLVQPLSPADAEVISRWQYAGPYAFYNRPSGRESESASYMLDPRNGFHAVRGASGLIGFCSFGVDGRVRSGAYDNDALDVGAGMDPALVGSGRGQAFLGAVIDYATLELKTSRLRATVASWNERALRALRSVGFRPLSTFQSDQGIEFTILLLETVATAGCDESGGMGDYHRRVATESEVDRLFGLHREAFKDHIEPLWGPWNDDWQRDNFRRECAESSCEVLVRGEAILGYVQHVDEIGRLCIWNIAILPQFRGQGIGSRIIREFQQLVRSRDAALVLRVFPTNVAALRFYERLGFRETSRSPTGIEVAWRAT